MAIFIKSDVKRGWLEPMPYIIHKLGEMFERYSEDLLITSGTEGAHMETSLHYIGHAVDFRPGSRSKGDIINTIKNAGYPETDFDLVDGYKTGHWHLEFDPHTGLWKMKQVQLRNALLNKDPQYPELREEWIKLRKEQYKHG